MLESCAWRVCVCVCMLPPSPSFPIYLSRLRGNLRYVGSIVSKLSGRSRSLENQFMSGIEKNLLSVSRLRKAKTYNPNTNYIRYATPAWNLHVILYESKIYSSLLGRDGGKKKKGVGGGRKSRRTRRRRIWRRRRKKKKKKKSEKKGKKEMEKKT